MDKGNEVPNQLYILVARDSQEMLPIGGCRSCLLSLVVVCVVRSLRYVGWWLCFSACKLRRKVVCLVCLLIDIGTEMKIEEEAEGTVA